MCDRRPCASARRQWPVTWRAWALQDQPVDGPDAWRGIAPSSLRVWPKTKVPRMFHETNRRWRRLEFLAAIPGPATSTFGAAPSWPAPQALGHGVLTLLPACHSSAQSCRCFEPPTSKFVFACLARMVCSEDIRVYTGSGGMSLHPV